MSLSGAPPPCHRFLAVRLSESHDEIALITASLAAHRPANELDGSGDALQYEISATVKFLATKSVLVTQTSISSIDWASTPIPRSIVVLKPSPISRIITSIWFNAVAGTSLLIGELPVPGPVRSDAYAEEEATAPLWLCLRLLPVRDVPGATDWDFAMPELIGPRVLQVDGDKAPADDATPLPFWPTTPPFASDFDPSRLPEPP